MKPEHIEILNEDFSSFSLGYLPSDITAIGEYHYYKPGYTGIWYEPNKCTSWQGRKCWMIKEMDGSNFIEQQLNIPLISSTDTLPLLIAGDKGCEDIIIESKVWVLAPTNRCGIVFRYTDSRHYYFFALEKGNRAVLYKKAGENLKVLSTADFDHGIDHLHVLRVEAKGKELSCHIDGETIISVEDADYLKGCIGIGAYCPTRFFDIKAWVPCEQHHLLAIKKREETARIAAITATHPKMKLWKIINLQDFGSSRAYRCADINGDGQKELLFIQSMPLMNTGDEQMISCMTTVNLDGEVLWQIGKPAQDSHMATCDLPVQIYDIDDDGYAEIIYCKDFKIIVADAATGETKYFVPTPNCIPHDNYKIYQNITLERIIGDSIRICNFSGNSKPLDLLIKDRYNNIWAYNNKLELLWHRQVNCGHFPYAFDINGDGKDELVVGHSLLSADGELIWELSGMKCHVDEIVIGKFDPNNDKYQIAMASGEDGFILVDQDGQIINQDMPGHAQRVSVANYRPDLPGLEICVVTFWRNTGIITMYDCKGNKLYSDEPGANGNLLSPVNWNSRGETLMLYSANVELGGLYNGFLEQIVRFPADGHPELCCDVIDLLGDKREELLTWDEKIMYIYTQDDNPSLVNLSIERYEDYNFSNYRGEFIYENNER